MRFHIRPRSWSQTSPPFASPYDEWMAMEAYKSTIPTLVVVPLLDEQEDHASWTDASSKGEEAQTVQEKPSEEYDMVWPSDEEEDNRGNDDEEREGPPPSSEPSHGVSSRNREKRKKLWNKHKASLRSSRVEV